MKDVDLGVKEWEDTIMYPLKVMRWILSFYLIVIVIVPVYKGSGLFIDSIFTGLCGLVLILGYLSRSGRIGDFKSLLFIVIIRCSHFFADLFFLKKVSLNFLVWVLIILLEVGLAFFYLVDSSRYEIVKELEEK